MDKRVRRLWNAASVSVRRHSVLSVREPEGGNLPGTLWFRSQSLPGCGSMAPWMDPVLPNPRKSTMFRALIVTVQGYKAGCNGTACNRRQGVAEITARPGGCIGTGLNRRHWLRWLRPHLGHNATGSKPATGIGV